ncbi:MAG TPA: LysM peptidoglycan-binding domain-containing protein [Thermomicrobiales bacterium]|nr:LysM peptidoglycan-binding domain-containing protein [Thermomicrobiales bacterium]
MTATTRPPERANPGDRRNHIQRSRRTVLATGVATAALVVGATASLAAGFFSHRVESGDTLSELAVEYGTTVDELVALNEIEDPDLIIVNDELRIRPLDEGDANTHTVISGETLTGIARSLGVTVDELAAANNLVNPDLIVTGDLLVVPAGDGSIAAVDEASDPPEDMDEDETTESTGNDEVASPVLVTNDVQPPTPASAVQAGTATLHLVLENETLASIAESYGVSSAQLLAANGHARNGVSSGMILKIPPADSTSVQLVGMPSAIEFSPVGSELTAVSVATAYWGSSISETSLYESLELSDNPHYGFRGDIHGEYGGTDDYGVYAGPLAEAVAEAGFVGEVFYGDGDASALTSRIDLGLPVIVWMTYQTAVVEPERMDDDVRPFTLVPEKQAVVVYGYDNEGVLIVDIANGGYAHVNWDDFMRSWGYFDGMGLVISPI